MTDMSSVIDRLVRILEAREREPYVTGLCLLLRSYMFGHEQVSLRDLLLPLPTHVRNDLFQVMSGGEWPDHVDFDDFHALIDG